MSCLIFEENSGSAFRKKFQCKKRGSLVYLFCVQAMYCQ